MKIASAIYAIPSLYPRKTDVLGGCKVEPQITKASFMTCAGTELSGSLHKAFIFAYEKLKERAKSPESILLSAFIM